MGIKLIKKTNEAAYTAVKNPKQAAFLIDCGSPEKAKELNDAFSALAEKVLDHNDKEAGDAIGRNVIMFYDVGPFFTACVDPCDKAAAWCEDWLRNSDGKAPGIQGNDASLESKENEELSPKMKQRLKLKAWQDNSVKMQGFDEAGYSFLDLYEGGKCPAFITPTKGYETEKEALDAAKKIFDDFDEYFEITALFDEAGGPDGEAVWFPAYGLKKTFVDLPEGEGLEVLSELSDVLYRLYTKGESASEDRRGTDRYGHHVKRFTTKDLGNTDPTFGRVTWSYKGGGTVGSEYKVDNLDRIVKALADMPIEKASIEKALAQFPPSIYPKHRIPHIAEFEPDIGVCRIGCHPASDIRQSYSYKNLELHWNPEGSEGT